VKKPRSDSSIESYGKPLRDVLELWLDKEKMSYRDAVSRLQKETGIIISKSALARYWGRLRGSRVEVASIIFTKKFNRKPRPELKLARLPKEQRDNLERILFDDNCSYEDAVSFLWENYKVKASTRSVESFYKYSQRKRMGDDAFAIYQTTEGDLQPTREQLIGLALQGKEPGNNVCMDIARGMQEARAERLASDRLANIQSPPNDSAPKSGV
jgi:hypothetical protein